MILNTIYSKHIYICVCVCVEVDNGKESDCMEKNRKTKSSKVKNLL